MNEELFKEYPDIVNLKMLCDMLHVGYGTAKDLLDTKNINSRRLGREYKIPKRDVIRFICS